jgi:ankyrin repeat protein
MDSFKYDPIDLDGCSFRLLRLCHATDGPTECHLFDARLDELIEYEALSYTWGDGVQPRKIVVNHNPMLVTPNLSQALWDLRYPNEDRILWVDAICINQEDVKERGHQVKHMASIYKNAKQVVVWLGRPNLDTSSIFRQMRQLEELATRHAYHEWKVSDQRWQELWSTTKPLIDVEHTDWLLRRGLQSIFDEQWFTRVWIIQEIANARSATIMCGRATVSSRIFAAMPSLVGMELDPHRQAILDIMPGPLRKHSWWAENRELRTLLLKFRWSKSSDPRDAIYALLGLSSDACDSRCLFPNYELSEEEVVRNTMAFLLSFIEPELPTPSLPQYKLPKFMENLDDFGAELLSWAVETGNIVLASHVLNSHGPGMELQAVDTNKLLQSALKHKYAAIARLLHDTGRCDINRRDEDDTTLLFRAVMKADVKSLKVLLDTDRADLDVKDKEGQTPFTMALDNSDWATLELLLRKHTTGDRDSTSATTLRYLASYGGQSAVMKLLLELPGVVTSRKKLIQKHLFRAIEQGIECEMKVLIDMGETDINTEIYGRTPFLLAVLYGHENVVKLLLNTTRVNLLATDSRGRTPLLLAVLNGHEKVIELLLDTRRADLVAKDKNGYSQFSSATQKNVKVVKTLMEFHKFSVENLAPYAGKNPLMLAFKFGRLEVVHALLNSEAFDPNGREYGSGRTPLMHAVQRKNMATMNLLLSIPNIESEAEDIYGQTALSYAVTFGEPQAVQLLLETSKASLNHKDWNGQTLIMRAKRRNHIEILQILHEREEVDADKVSASKNAD